MRIPVAVQDAVLDRQIKITMEMGFLLVFHFGVSHLMSTPSFFFQGGVWAPPVGSSNSPLLSGVS